jgi:PIN domain nuclease of toxin-antitoxin system
VTEDTSNQRLLSAASSWEIAIKYRLGKLRLPNPPKAYVAERMLTSLTTPLAVEHAHALAVADLPDHHGDPFDRLLIAQAIQERATLITADPQIRPYDVELLWVGA